MTTNKIVVSMVAAAAIATGTYAAGTISASGNGSMSEELLKVKSVTATNAMQGVVYNAKADTGKLNSQKNPVIDMKFTNVSGITVTSAALWLVKDGNESNATAGDLNFEKVATVTNNGTDYVTLTAVSADVYIYSDKKYVLRDETNATTAIGGTAKEANIDLTVAKGSTAGFVTVKFVTGAGDSQTIWDTTSTANLFEIKEEFSVKYKSDNDKFNALIDAANSRSTFISSNTEGTLADTLHVVVTDANLTYKFITNTTNGKVKWVVSAEGNTTDYITNMTAAAATGFGANTGVVTNGNTYYTFTSTANVSDFNSTKATDINATATITPNKSINDTKFAMSFDLISDEGNVTKYNKDIVTDAGDAGKWETYGYTGQITDAVVSSTKETYINITNSSTRTANAFFTILPDTIQANGTAVNAGVTACNADAGSVGANQTRKVQLSTLLATCTGGFPTTGEFALELSVPTTPNEVYVNAVQKNSTVPTAPQFKDLPVYNNKGNGF